MQAAPKGKLFLVPAPLDFGCATQTPLDETMPAGTLAVAAQLTHWICENAKSARAYLKRIDELHPLAAPLREQQIAELPREVHKKGDHEAGGFDARPLLAAALGGRRHGPAQRSRHAGHRRPGLLRGAGGARAGHCRWCRWSVRSRCCSRSRPAASTGRTSPSWATCRRTRRSASSASASWKRWRSSTASRSCSSRRRIATRRCGMR